MPIENNKEGIKNINANTKNQHKDLDRLARQENDIKKNNMLDAPNYVERIDKDDTHKVLEPVSREDQLMSGTFDSIERRLNPSLAEALRVLWKAEQEKEELSGLTQQHITTDAGSIITLTNPPQGPYLDKGFEEHLFKIQGYNSKSKSETLLEEFFDNKYSSFTPPQVEIVRYPDSPCDTFGYALLGKGCLRDKQGIETILKENFIRTQTPRQGDRLIYRNPSTGEAVFAGWIEKVEDGKVTKVTSIWRDRGAICQHAPDVRKSLGNREYYRRNVKVLDNFEQIGGKTELADAQFIFLGESHVDEKHCKDMLQFLDDITKNDQKHYIVFAEGLKAGEKQAQEDWLSQKIQALTKLLNSEEEIASFKNNLPSLSKRFDVVGWDNMKLHKDELKLGREGYKLKDEIEKANRKQDQKTADDLSLQLRNLRKEDDDLALQRNKSMLKTLNDKRQEFPNSIFITIAGKFHITEDSSLKVFLDTESCIALSPIHELTKEENIKRCYKMYIEGHEKCIQLIQQHSQMITQQNKCIQEHKMLIQTLEIDIDRLQDEKLIEQQKKLIQQGKRLIQLQKEITKQYNKLTDGNNHFDTGDYTIVNLWFKDVQSTNNTSDQWNKFTQQESTDSKERAEMMRIFDEKIEKQEYFNAKLSKFSTFL